MDVSILAGMGDSARHAAAPSGCIHLTVGIFRPVFLNYCTAVDGYARFNTAPQPLNISSGTRFPFDIKSAPNTSRGVDLCKTHVLRTCKLKIHMAFVIAYDLRRYVLDHSEIFMNIS